MESQQTPLYCDDDLYVEILTNDSQNLEQHNQTLEADSKYAEELQLQEVIISSLQPSNIPEKVSREIGESGKISREIGEPSSNPGKISMAIGESSQQGSRREPGKSSQTLCEICADKKDNGDMFPLDNCIHNFCTECISKHVSITIKKRIISDKPLTVTCPGMDCTTILEINKCRQILHENVASMWDGAICEALISPSQRFYCPFKNCSGVLVHDDDGDKGIKEAECPYCWRLFCANCEVPWHSGVDCEEFLRMRENEKSEREDAPLHELAKKNEWQRCPSCKYFVERTEGCMHMTCRCAYQFCYRCGGTWTNSHEGVCPKRV